MNLLVKKNFNKLLIYFSIKKMNNSRKGKYKKSANEIKINLINII